MSQLRAHVYRDRATAREHIVEVYLDVDGPCWILRCQSWPEAMQAAELMHSTLSRLLMDQVHASRASRRYPKPQLDVHTMEATA